MPDNSLTAGHSQNKLPGLHLGGCLFQESRITGGVKPYTKRKVKMENFSVGVVLISVGWVSGLKGKNRRFRARFW